MKFVAEVLSRKGGRRKNEDWCDFALSDGAGCWAVADGLGGHRGGEVASRLAVEAVLDAFARGPREAAPDTVRTLLRRAQDAVVARQEEDPALASMRTTLTVLVADEETGQAAWGHVGDSRLYFFRSGAVVEQTRDHSVPWALAEAGDISPDDVRFHEDRDRLLRVLGKGEDFRPETVKRARLVKPGDAFLLCVDGFWEYVTETEMEADLAKSETPGEWLRFMERRLLARAGEKHDNYTAAGVFAE